MHQQTYCHTLPKPFSQIFLFRIYAPTIHSTDIDSDETSDRLPHISAPIQPPQTNPPTTPFPHIFRAHTATQNQSTKRHTNSTPTLPHKTNPPTPTNLHASPHKCTPRQRPQIHAAPQTHTTQPRPTDVDVDTVAPTLTHSQAGCSRSVRNSTGQASDRIRLNQTRQDQATAAIGQAKQTGSD